jgi:threonine dehydrogenase-like Zn-dependent dehydrogenase
MLFEPNDQGLILGKNPVTIGHEGTGHVVSTGSGEVASKFNEGDPVGFICPVGCCFKCHACTKVHNAWCETGKTKMQGFSENGYFAEYAVVDARNAMVLPSNCGFSAFVSAKQSATKLTARQWIPEFPRPCSVQVSRHTMALQTANSQLAHGSPLSDVEGWDTWVSSMRKRWGTR